MSPRVGLAPPRVSDWKHQPNAGTPGAVVDFESLVEMLDPKLVVGSASAGEDEAPRALGACWGVRMLSGCSNGAGFDRLGLEAEQPSKSRHAQPEEP